MEKTDHKSKLKLEKQEQHKQKTSLRKIRLDIPESSELSKNSSSKTPQKNESTTPNDPTDNGEKIVIYLPSILYQFDDSIPPTFIYEVVLPSSTYTFKTTPSPQLLNPRFFVYTVAKNGSLPINVSISVNNNTFRHITGDESPIDFTDALSSFGSDSMLAVETDAFVVPFVIVGVWVSQKSMNDIIDECATGNSFSCLQSDIDPITRAPVVIPGRGRQCDHNETFDAAAFIGKCIATDSWICPICGVPIPLDELQVDTSRRSLTPILDEPLDNGDWNQNHAFDDLLVKGI